MSSSFFPVPPRINRILSRRKSRRLKLKIVSGLVTLLFIGFILSLVGTAVAFAYFAKDLPSPDKLSEKNFSQSTKILDRNGNLLYNVFGEENRTLVKLDKIPKDLKNATIAIEDQNFYKHKGIDMFGIVRAARDALLDRKVTGASTLTQQLVKNALLSNERTVTRKAKEFILAIQIERRYSKDQILQIYLNEIPYGGTASGAEAAATQYFGKHVSELSLTESAILAGLPQLPSAYSPFGNNPTAYIDRTKDVLRRMREDGYITKEEEKKAAAELPNVKFAAFGQGIKAPHFSIYVKNLLEEKYGSKVVQEGGLTVTTSLNLGLQEEAQKIVSEQVAAAKNLRVGNGAAIVQDVKTGEVHIWVGSKDYFAQDIPGQYDIVSQAVRQPGSALKPFNYLTGFEKGYTPSTMYLDISTDFGNGYKPGNYDDREHGPTAIRPSLGNSYNIPAVKMLAVNGVDTMIKTMKRFGVTTLNDPSEYGLSLTLGGGGIHLLELNNAYSILGNGGKEVKPVVILKVTDSEGKVLEEYKPPTTPKQVTTPEHAYLVNNVLADPTAKYAAYGQFWASRLNFRKDLAVKTGTSELKIDNWAFGYSPSYSIGTWVGNNDNSPMHPSLASGVTGAAPIYRALAERVFGGKKVEEWPRPAGIVNAEVDAVSGMKPGKYTTEKRNDVFAKWQVPSQEDDMHKEVRICKPTGKLAGPSCEAAGLAETQVFLVMYDPYIKLFRPDFTYCKPCPPTETDNGTYSPSGQEEPTSLSVTITSPADDASVGQTFWVEADVRGPNPITRVEFRLDNESPKVVLTAPYRFQFTNVKEGDHEIRVRAFDTSGDSETKRIDVKVSKSGTGAPDPIPLLIQWGD